MIARTFLAAALAPAALLLSAAPRAQGPLARALPQDTLMYLSMPDLDTTIEEFQQTALAKIWREPQVQDFFTPVMNLVEQQWSQGLEQAREAHKQGMLPFNPDDLVKMRIHSVAFAVTQMGLEMREGMTEPLPKFGVVVHLDFGDSAAIWQNVINTGLAMLQAEAGNEIQVETKELAGAKITMLRATEMPDFPMGLDVAFVGNGIVLSTLAGDTQSILTNLGAKAGGTSSSDTLAKSANFLRTSTKLDYHGTELEFYLRPGALFDFVGNTLRLAREHAPDFPPMINVEGIERAITALGLRSFDAIGATWHYRGDRAVADSFVSMPADARQGFTAGVSKPLDMGFLRWVPKDAVSFSASRMSLGGVYGSLVGALEAYDENLAKMALGQLQQLEQQLELSLEKDVFGALGDELVTWSMPMASMTGLPEMAFIVKVNNQEGLIKSLQKLAALSRGMVGVDKVERRGTTYWQVQVRMDDLDQFGGMNPFQMFTPTFAFKGGYLVGGLSTSDVRRASERMDRADDPAGDIRSNAEFKAYIEQIPAQASSLSFTDWKTQFDGYYQILSGLMALIPFDETVPIDPALLPESSTITKHLFGACSWSLDGNDGVASHSVSPFGPEMVVMLGAAVLGGAGAVLAVRGEAGMFRR